MERTLVLIKPDGVRRRLMGQIIDRIERKGFRITEMKMMALPIEVAETHYGEHKGKPFFENLVLFMTSEPLVAMIVEGPQAICGMRNLMGVTNPIEALPGTIRGDFGVVTSENLVHGSDSLESAEREIKLFFS
jgi:nucleoside-diphosphate kinase